MDDTQKSRTSDANSTRKRRSSILKSQRPPRTPFSELEFNVATPTDTVKSRRVSFSRRTGVAEFVTNEATTTWKNFYEEHNKSLESSGNDSEVKPPRQVIGHIGKRIFDQQFEEVEAVDFLHQLNKPSLNINTSINNINLTQQLATLENTDNLKLTAPHANFELSMFTENNSKLFGDEFTTPMMGEKSERIDINFSDIQTIDQGKDDLDEIQKDLARAQNDGYTGPFTDRQNMSEYIEIDLNTTHITMGNEQSDMSITDTIHSHVQDVSKSCSIDKKLKQTKDWVTDKENITINPYVMPHESVNFTINNELDKVLVFDGKRLTLQDERHDKNFRKTLIPNGTAKETPQRKTIVLNINDDLPNFIENMNISKIHSSKQSISNCVEDELPCIPTNRAKNITFTDQEHKSVQEAHPLQNMLETDSNQSRTVLYEPDTCNISVTQALAANIIQHNPDKIQTILYEDDGNISVTQAASLNVLPKSLSTEKRRIILFEKEMANNSLTQTLPETANIIDTETKQSEETVYDGISVQNDNGMESVTKGISANILNNAEKCDKDRTIMFGTDTINISVTQTVRNNIIVSGKDSSSELTKSKLYENDTGNISITQAVPNTIVLQENETQSDRRTTILYENDTGNLSVTQAIPSNIIVLENETQAQRRRTILYENDTGNLSVTQAIPSNIIVPENETQAQRRRTILYENDTCNLSVTQAIPSNIIVPENEKQAQRRRTILYANDTGNLSVTQAIPSNIIVPENVTQAQRRRTILYENDTGNISVTQAIPSNIIVPEHKTQAQRRRAILYENDTGNVSVTQAVASNIIVPENETQAQRRTILYENDTGNLSVTQAIPSNIIVPENETQAQKRRTILYENDTGNLSVTQAVPSNIIVPENETQPQRRRTILYENDTGNLSVTQAVPSNIIVPENETQAQRRRTILYENDTGNLSVTQAIPSNIIVPEHETQAPRRRAILYENDTGNVSVTQAVPSNIIVPENEAPAQRRRTLLYENDTCNVSVTQAAPSNIIVPENVAQVQRRRTILYEKDTGNVSVTQAVPSNIIVPENEPQAQRRRTILYENDTFNVSVTQAVPSNIILPENETQVQRRRTILYENDTGNVSVTQAVPSNIILPQITTNAQKKDAILYDTDTDCVSVNQVISKSILSQRSNFETYEVNTCNMSITQSVPHNINSEGKDVPIETNNLENDVSNIIVTKTMSNNVFLHKDQNLAENKNNISFENAAGLNSTIHLVPTNESIHGVSKIDHNSSKGAPNVSLVLTKPNILNDNFSSISNKSSIMNKDESRPLLCQEFEADILTAPISVENDILSYCEKKENIRNTTAPCDNFEFIMTDVVTSELLINKSELEIEKEENKYEIVNNVNAHICAKQKVFDTLSTDDKKNHIIISEYENNEKQELEIEKTRCTVVENCIRSETITKPIPTTLSSIQKELMEKPIKECNTNREASHANGEVLMYQALMRHSGALESKTTEQEYSKDQKNICDERFIPLNENISAADVEQITFVTGKINTELLTDDEMIHNSESTDISNNMNDRKASENLKRVILDNMLDMSNALIEDKNVMTQIVSEQQLLEDTVMENNDNISAESMFYITKDSDSENQSDKEIDWNVSPSSQLDKIEENPPNVDNLHKKLVELKNIIDDGNRSPPHNRHYEKIVCVGIENNIQNHIESQSLISISMRDRKSYKTADDTDYLLQMLSDLTENKPSDIIVEDDNPEIVDQVLTIEENNSKVIENRRISNDEKKEFVLSRDDQLKNSSLHEATFQKSRSQLDKSKNIEDPVKGSSINLESPCKKTVRMSNEVVKTLHFEEDDTVSEASIESDKITPLKKTAFGETSYMKEGKAKVIPSYLKDVSDGIKALMHDLVKPTADTMPFEAIGPDKSLKKTPSTCNTEIQANLITSSQIDLDTGLYSNPTSSYDFNTQAAFTNEIKTTDKIANSNAIKSSILSLPKTEIEKSWEYDLTSKTDFSQCKRQKRLSKQQSVPGEVLVFDHENPLNNVFLAPTDCADVHRYNPGISDATLCGTEQNRPASISANEKDTEVERISMQYNVDSRGVLPHVTLQSGDACTENITGVHSRTSTTSKPLSINQSTDVRMVEVKNMQINTSITMKGNRELLEASSSLTLVDDALTQNVFDVDVDSNTTTSRNSFKTEKPNSSVKIIYPIDEYGIKSEKKDSDFTTNDEETSKLKEQKRKKRNYSSTKHKNSNISDIDVTPKPTTKVQKMSSSPKNINKTILDLHDSLPDKPKVATNKMQFMRDEEMPSPDKVHSISSQRSKGKAEKKLTVQTVTTEYHMEASMDQKSRNKQIVEALADQSGEAKSVNSNEAPRLDAVCSFTSSKNGKEQDDHSRFTSSVPVSDFSEKSVSCVTKQSDLVKEFDSGNFVSECESSDNVIARIDMLPFMGSNECEWEWSCGDTWSFRLLHGRLRLTVRFAPQLNPQLDNGTNTCVRANTPVISINVEIAQQDKKNPVATWCVCFALETMRYLCSRRWSCAGSVPTLVRRCTAAARLAARWARHMHHAQAHLAYTLTDDGRLLLKVANIPLRSVWEVSMQLELVVGETDGVPWPRACHVRVSRVVSECDVSETEARVRAALAAVSHDWGHVPTTVWRIFKYLKNKTRDEALLAA